MSESLQELYVKNALRFIKAERRSARKVNEAYLMLSRCNIQAGLVDWLANPYLRTALSILEKFTGNYKIQQAVKLLREAGEDQEKVTKSAKKKPSSKRR